MLLQALLDGDNPLRRLGELFRLPIFWIFSLPLILYLLVGLYSEDLSYWQARVRIKLSYLLIPAAFFLQRPWSLERWEKLLQLFIALSVFSAAATLGYFFLGYNEYVDAYKGGSVMPTLVNHVRYSLLLAAAAVSAIYLVLQGRSGNKKVLIASGIFLFLFIHVLAVRSGILAVWLALIYLFIAWIIREGRYKVGVMLLLSMTAFIAIAYYSIPTLRGKIEYTKYSLHGYFNGEVNPDLSDAKRIGSIQAGLEVARENPILGVGIGDIKHALHWVYADRYPDLMDEDPLPHNQFILILAACGILGLIVFLIHLIGPWIYLQGQLNSYFIAFQLMAFSSMMTENTVESQLGASWFLFFTLMGLMRKSTS